MTKKELEAENAALRAELDTQPAASQTDETIQARLAVLEEELVDKEEQIADLSAQVARLSKAEAKKPSPVADLDPVKVGKKLYRFAFPATFWKGKKITAEDVRDSDELITELIAAGSGMLVEQ